MVERERQSIARNSVDNVIKAIRTGEFPAKTQSGLMASVMLILRSSLEPYKWARWVADLTEPQSPVAWIKSSKRVTALHSTVRYQELNSFKDSVDNLNNKIASFFQRITPTSMRPQSESGSESTKPSARDFIFGFIYMSIFMYPLAVLLAYLARLMSDHSIFIISIIFSLLFFPGMLIASFLIVLPFAIIRWGISVLQLLHFYIIISTIWVSYRIARTRDANRTITPIDPFASELIRHTTHQSIHGTLFIVFAIIFYCAVNIQINSAMEPTITVITIAIAIIIIMSCINTGYRLFSGYFGSTKSEMSEYINFLATKGSSSQ
jgi:hypothetical protein